MARKLTLLGFATFLLGCDSIPSSSAVTNSPILPPQPVSTANAPRSIDFHIKGVRLNDSEKNVFKHLGKPESRKIETVDYCGISKILKLRYPGIEIWLDRGSDGNESEWRVLEFTIDSPSLLLSPGVRVGDSIEAVKHELGDPHTDVSDQERHDLYYLSRDDDNADFEILGNKVVSIRLFINPC